MTTQLIVYAEDAIAQARLTLGHDRLADLLVTTEPVRTTRASVRALDGGRHVDLPELELDRSEILIAVPDGHRGDLGRRLGTVARPAVLRIGPYEVAGHLHGPASTNPFSLARRRSWIAMTEATVRYRANGRVVTHARPTVLVNGGLPFAIEPTTDEDLEARRPDQLAWSTPKAGAFAVNF